MARDDEYSTDEDTKLTVPSSIGVLDNDFDPDGDLLIAILVINGPGNGILMLNTDGSFMYTPDPDFNGTDTFTYTANDGEFDSNVATVTITVNPVDAPPMAVNDTFTIDLRDGDTMVMDDVSLNDFSIDGSIDFTSFVQIGSDPEKASVFVFNANGTFTYELDFGENIISLEDGEMLDVTFQYQFDDDSGLSSNTATVTITIIGEDEDTGSGCEIFPLPSSRALQGDLLDVLRIVELTDILTENYFGGVENAGDSAGNDIVIGTDEIDNLSGGAGEDYIDGRGAGDSLAGGAGSDIVYGRSGNENIIAGGACGDYLQGGLGNDEMKGDAGNDLMVGDQGNDRMEGNSGDDVMSGGSENDTMFGGSGNDLMAGDTGDDELTGGAGEDTFIYIVQLDNQGELSLRRNANGDLEEDVVVDFGKGNDFLGFINDTGGFFNIVDLDQGTDFDTSQNVNQTNGNDTIITFDGGDKITLYDIQINSFAEISSNVIIDDIV